MLQQARTSAVFSWSPHSRAKLQIPKSTLDLLGGAAGRGAAALGGAGAGRTRRGGGAGSSGRSVLLGAAMCSAALGGSDSAGLGSTFALGGGSTCGVWTEATEGGGVTSVCAAFFSSRARNDIVAAMRTTPITPPPSNLPPRDAGQNEERTPLAAGGFDSSPSDKL